MVIFVSRNTSPWDVKENPDIRCIDVLKVETGIA